MCTVQCGKQKLWSSAVDFTVQPLFIFWMDCVADKNHGNFYFCVKYSVFMMKKKKLLAVLCGILKFFLELYLTLLGGEEGLLSSPSRCWIFLRVCGTNTTFPPRSRVYGIQWFLKNGKNLLMARWDLECFLAVDLERLGWAIRKKTECFS